MYAIFLGKFKSLDNYTQNVTNIVELQKLLEAEDHNMVVHSNGKVISDQEIEQLLDRSELYEEMEKRNQKQLWIIFSHLNYLLSVLMLFLVCKSVVVFVFFFFSV